MKRRNLLSILLAFLLVFGISIPAFSAEDPPENTLLVSKISDELSAKLEEIRDDDKVQVYIWIRDINYEEVEVAVKQSTGFNKESFSVDQDDFNLAVDFATVALREDENTFAKKRATEIRELLNGTAEERAIVAKNVDNYIVAERAISRQKYNLKQEEFESGYLQNADIIFQSQYAPMIICEVTKADVYRLENVEQVVSLSLYEDLEGDGCASLEIHQQTINADYTKDTLGLSGQGVKIGQIDMGWPDVTDPELSGADITKVAAIGANPYIQSHPTSVAKVLVGSNGMAPNASLVCVDWNSFYPSMEALLNANIHVNNMSCIRGSGYDDASKWVDHIVNQHNVIWVQSTGNYANGKHYYVHSPATAYNVITVGGIEVGTPAKSRERFWSDSCYIDQPGAPNKPDVVAPAAVFFDGGSGTTYSAPMVTGVVAQLMEAKPALKAQPHLVKAIIMASCDRKVPEAFGGPVLETMAQLTDKQGAGVVSAKNAVYSGGYTGTLDPNDTLSETGVVLKPHVPVSIVLTWFKQNETTAPPSNPYAGTSPDLTDLNLEVYDSNDVLVKFSSSTTNNVEYVRFTPTSSQPYKIRVVRNSHPETTERFAIAYTVPQNTLIVTPNAGETMVEAITRELGIMPAANITNLSLQGNAVMGNGLSSADSASTMLPNLQIADLSAFQGRLGSYSFMGCGNLTTVKLAKNVSIGDHCFENCTDLEVVIFDPAQTTKFSVGTEAFYNVSTNCVAYMSQTLASAPTFHLPRSGLANISKVGHLDATLSGGRNEWDQFVTVYDLTHLPFYCIGDAIRLDWGNDLYLDTTITDIDIYGIHVEHYLEWYLYGECEITKILPDPITTIPGIRPDWDDYIYVLTDDLDMLSLNVGDFISVEWVNHGTVDVAEILAIDRWSSSSYILALTSSEYAGEGDCLITKVDP